MKKYSLAPYVSQIIPLSTAVIVLTSVDYQKSEGTYKLFGTYEDALDWVHSVSLKQHPTWHKESCLFCKTGEHP